MCLPHTRGDEPVRESAPPVTNEICRHRARVYELARQRHPLRWSGTTRYWHQPVVVWINPPPPEIGINPAKLVVAA